MQLDLQDLKRRLDLRELIQADLGPGKRTGKQIQYRSPFRQDTRPSFSVYANGYYDFGSGEAGDVFTWLQKWHGLSFVQALDQVTQLVNGLPVPPSRPLCGKLYRAQRLDDPPGPDWQQAALSALEAAEHYLWSPSGTLVLEYLRTVRGLNDATLRHFRLGYNPGWTRTRCQKPDTGSTIVYASLPPGIVIPWFSQGNLYALKVRCRVGDLAEALGVQPDHLAGKPAPKYLNLAGGHQSGALFNADAISPDLPVLFVEGEFDAMLGWQLGRDQVATVTLGSATQDLAPRWQAQLQAYPIVYSALDNDAAGQQATRRLTDQLGHRHRAIPLPRGKDLTEFVIHHHGNVTAWLAQVLETRPEPYWRVVPEAWRAAIAQYLPDPVGPLLEFLASAGLLVPGQLLSRPMLSQLTPKDGLSSDTLRAGLDAAHVFLEKVGLLPAAESGQETPDSAVSCSKTPRLARGGRGKVQYYRVLPLEQATRNLLRQAACRIWERCHPLGLAQPLGRPQPGFFTALDYPLEEARALADELEALLQPVYCRQSQAQRLTERQAKARFQRLKRSLADPCSLPLPEGWPYRNVREYRAAHARAIKAAQPERDLSLKQWAAALGICQRSVPAVLARAGITSRARYEDRTVHSAEEVLRLGYQLKGYPRRILSAQPGKQPREFRYDSQRLTSELAVSREIVVRFQVVNKQRLIPLAQPQQTQQGQPNSRRQPADSAPIEAQKQTHRRPYRGRGYDPHYVQTWLALALALLRDYLLDDEGRVIDKQTGEILADQPGPLALIRLLRHPPAVEPDQAGPP